MKTLPKILIKKNTDLIHVTEIGEYVHTKARSDIQTIPHQSKFGYIYFFLEKQLFKVAKQNVFYGLFLAVLALISFIPSQAQAEPNSCSRDINLLSPQTKAKYLQLEKEAKNAGIEFKIICTYRTQAVHDAMYRQGRTTPGRKVTWTRTSKHCIKKAFDVAVFKSGNIIWNGSDYLRLGNIGKKLGLRWGGDWKEKDYGHFELVEGK